MYKKKSNAWISCILKGENQKHICVSRVQTENHATITDVQMGSVIRHQNTIHTLTRHSAFTRHKTRASVNDSHLFCWASSWMLENKTQNLWKKVAGVETRVLVKRRVCSSHTLTHSCVELKLQLSMNLLISH